MNDYDYDRYSHLGKNLVSHQSDKKKQSAKTWIWKIVWSLDHVLPLSFIFAALWNSSVLLPFKFTPLLQSKSNNSKLAWFHVVLWPVGDFPAAKVDRFRHLENPSGRIMFIFSLAHRCLGPWKLTSGRKIKSPLTQSLWMFENEVPKRLETSSEKKRP